MVYFPLTKLFYSIFIQKYFIEAIRQINTEFNKLFWQEESAIIVYKIF